MSTFNHVHYIFGLLCFLMGLFISAFWFAKSKDILIIKDTQRIVDKTYLERLEKTIASMKKREQLFEDDDL